MEISLRSKITGASLSNHLTGQAIMFVGNLWQDKLSSAGNAEMYFESDNLLEQKLMAGEVLDWKLSAKAQYPCNGRIQIALAFGGQVKALIEPTELPGGNVENTLLSGSYTLTEEDSLSDSLQIRLTCFEEHGINIFIDYVDLKIRNSQTAGPAELKAKKSEGGISLTWPAASDTTAYNIYRSSQERRNYKKIASAISGGSYTDKDTISGQYHYYFVTRAGAQESSASPIVYARKTDPEAPPAVTNLQAKGDEFTVQLHWKTPARDIESYELYRSEGKGERLILIATGIKKSSYLDTLPIKQDRNEYAVRAIDYSGNKGPFSERIAAHVTTVPGASFSDLILPIPIYKELRSDLWGTEHVLPRDADNGIEDPKWSYWGGKLVKDKSDGKYHMLVVRWPEDDRRGHWAWPDSTVAHVVSESPTGPFKVKKDLAYDYANGRGHNSNIILLNDGTFALYSLINWKPTIFTSETMNGPWKREGEIQINKDSPLFEKERAYRYNNNLTGVQCEDGSILITTKAGAVMRSTSGLLGPYEVLNLNVNHNKTIPKPHSEFPYEDPAFWYDGVQYHMLINAFLHYRAIYLRSPDGVSWKCETGFAYTPTSIIYEDGTRPLWYKLERPNVLQDEFGRATHLSLAALDVPKRQDYANDKHNSKHLILPLTVYRRIDMLNEKPVNADTKRIKILLKAEDGFAPTKELNLGTLRFGASEEVNFGRGSKVINTTPHQDGLIIEFDGTGNGMSEKNFACKLIGQTKAGDLVVGYSKTTR